MPSLYRVRCDVWFKDDDEGYDGDELNVVAESGSVAAAAAITEHLARKFVQYDDDGKELDERDHPVRADVESIERLQTIDLVALD